VQFDVQNACFATIEPETREDTYVYPLMTFIHEAPTILVKQNEDGRKGMAMGMIHIIRPGALFIIDLGEVGMPYQLVGPPCSSDATTLDGRLVSRDEERGLALYSAPHGLTFCVQTGVPLDEARLYSLKGSFVLQTSLISSARGSTFYPFDTYQFAGGAKFLFNRTFLNPTIVSDLSPAEGLAIRLPREQKAVTIASGETWHLNLRFGRSAKAWQFVGAFMVLVLASAMIHFNSSLGTISRIMLHSLAFAVFFWWTHPTVRGVPFLYPARMVPVCIIVIALMMAEYFR
jgi:hypothetical protein